MIGLLIAAIALGPRDQPHRPLPGVPDRRHRRRSSSACSCSRASASDTAPWLASRLHARRRRRHRARDAGARAGRPERRAAGEHRRRDRDGDVLPLDGRLVRRRDLRCDLRRAPRRPARALPASGRRAPRQRRPAQPRGGGSQLPPTIHADFLDAFAHALHGVFLWGMAIAIIPFVLSWFLKEVPLRTTLGRPAELAASSRRRGRRRRTSSSEPLVERC